MPNQHPVTPSSELVASLCDSAPYGLWETDAPRERWLINHAYAAGADHQLKACCEVLDDVPGGCATSRHLFHVCRPQPPSDKELALNALSLIMSRQKGMFDGKPFDTVRQVLEALPND
jgi:hypothetical protein